MKIISIVTPCFNEEKNVEELYNEIKKTFKQLKKYKYEHIFIDNSSTDNTVEILKKIASKDKKLKIIVNSRNFGMANSPYYAKLQAKGDAIIPVVADMQTPAECIPKFINKWEQGFPVVLGVRSDSHEAFLMKSLRKLYYKIISKFSDVEQFENFTGFGLFDKKIISILKDMDNPAPYFRGLISEIGFEKATVEYVQPNRKNGRSNIGLYTLFDYAMLGITSHSKIPLRLTVIFGFFTSLISLFFGFFYLIRKLIYWDTFSLGLAPAIIGIFIFFSIQMIFLGILGEYVGFIHTQVQNKPLVIEKERINFD